MTSPGNYDTDMMDMFAVHKALLTSLDSAGEYIARAGTDLERAEAIRSFYENVIEMLHVHHTGEDELIYPLLEQRCPESRSLLERIDDQHKLLPARMEAGRSAVAAWRAEPSAGNGRAVIDAMSSISATLRRHLTDEEATVVPMAAKWITPEEMGRMAGHGMQVFRGDKPWLMMGLVREQLDQPHRDSMLAHMPPQMRTAWTEQMEPAFNAFVRRVRG